MEKELGFEMCLDTLGGVATLGRDVPRNYYDLDGLVRAGIPTSAFEHAVSVLGEPEATIAAGIGIPRTTLTRRKASGRFTVDESERVVRLARVVALGTEALGSREAAGRWLLKANRALGGAVPLSLLSTDLGTREVESVLGRALLGGYS